MEQAVFLPHCAWFLIQTDVFWYRDGGTAWDEIAFPGGHVEPGESFMGFRVYNGDR